MACLKNCCQTILAILGMVTLAGFVIGPSFMILSFPLDLQNGSCAVKNSTLTGSKLLTPTWEVVYEYKDYDQSLAIGISNITFYAPIPKRKWAIHILNQHKHHKAYNCIIGPNFVQWTRDFKIIRSAYYSFWLGMMTLGLTLSFCIFVLVFEIRSPNQKQSNRHAMEFRLEEQPLLFES